MEIDRYSFKVEFINLGGMSSVQVELHALAGIALENRIRMKTKAGTLGMSRRYYCSKTRSFRDICIHIDLTEGQDNVLLLQYVRFINTFFYRLSCSSFSCHKALSSNRGRHISGM